MSEVSRRWWTEELARVRQTLGFIESDRREPDKVLCALQSARRAVDALEHALSSVPSRPDPDRLLDAARDEIRRAPVDDRWHVLDDPNVRARVLSEAGVEEDKPCETCDPYPGEGRVPMRLDDGSPVHGIDGKPMTEPCPDCSGVSGSDAGADKGRRCPCLQGHKFSEHSSVKAVPAGAGADELADAVAEYLPDLSMGDELSVRDVLVALARYLSVEAVPDTENDRREAR